MKFGVVVFPGTWSDVDCHYVLREVFHHQVEYVWHQETDLSSYDCIVLPGGFSYGDYLRAGAIARFSPIMRSIIRFVDQGKLVIGICNGFQILCEAGLLPGALMRNVDLEFRCEWVNLRVESVKSPFTNLAKSGQILKIPISHGEGRYFAQPNVIETLELQNQVILRYCSESGDSEEGSNPNGSISNIAGIVNDRGNVMGMMPHPERCCELLVGGEDGRYIFGSMFNYLAKKTRLLADL